MKANIGIKPEFLAKMAELLSVFLADEFLLSLKTRNAHWNMEGPDFYTKHMLFEQQYKQLDEIVDDIAEYIRGMGHYAPATLTQFLQFTHLSERHDELNSGKDYVNELLADHESIIIRSRGLDRFGTELKDSGISDFITGIMRIHEKMAWMLRAQLK